MKGISPEEIRRQRSSWDLFNVSRIFSAISLFSPAESDVFGIVPVLLDGHCTGIEGLKPAPEAPCGIQRWSPNRTNLDALERIAPGAGVRGTYKPRIISLALVGSLGTVAQTEKSDFDYILFIDRREFSRVDLFALERKLSAIEQWVEARMGVEAHFFIQDVEEFRHNRFGVTDKENVGSALGKLFKDEFYRTAIWVAGKRPLWWLLPPDYPELMESDFLAATGGVGLDDYVDLGHLAFVEEGEYFGAALWQINKALGSPFKSVLKMGLLESYLFNPIDGLLCEEVKRRVLEPGADMEAIDPYVMMFERADAFYALRGMRADAALLKKAFLLKTGVGTDEALRLLRVRTESMTRKERVIAALIKKWGWDAEKLGALDDFFSYNPRRQKGHPTVYKYFVDAYVRLSDYRRTHKMDDLFISVEDMTVLGRKLFTFFEQVPGKIPFAQFTSTPDFRRLAVLPVDVPDEGRRWAVYPGTVLEVMAEANTLAPLAQAKTLMEVLAWITVNKLWTAESRLHFRAEGSGYREEDVLFILNALRDFCSTDVFAPGREDYLAERTVVRVFAAPNFGGRNATGDTLIRHVDLLLHDSWGEYRHLFLPAKEGIAETAVMMRVAEERGRKIHLKVAPPPSQNDPRLEQEFEYSVHRMVQRGLGDTTSIKKSTLDLL